MLTHTSFANPFLNCININFYCLSILSTDKPISARERAISFAFFNTEFFANFKAFVINLFHFTAYKFHLFHDSYNTVHTPGVYSLSINSFMICLYILIYPFLNHLNAYIKIVGDFINLHSVRSHRQC